ISSGSFETILQPNNDVLIKWGANFTPLTLEGEWWRLFTSMFQHIGIIALVLTNLLEKSVRDAILKSIGIFITYNLLFGLKTGVDNSAHIGGLLSGFVIGFLLYFDIAKVKMR